MLKDTKPPSGCVPIRDLLDGKREVGSMVSVIGIITDFRAPVATRGQDWKCQIRLYDRSTEGDTDESLLVNVFRPEKEMPTAECGDIIFISSAKLQRWQSEAFSLITSRGTNIDIYQGTSIPKPPQDASVALRPPAKPGRRRPNESENNFISVFFHSVDKSRLPTIVEFNNLKESSLNVRDKFRELKDLRDGNFADCIVQIVKQPYALGDRTTLWVSDFTENPSFFNYSFKGTNVSEEQDRRSSSNAVTQTDWTGPFGKQSMQVTCYEPHASVIREQSLTDGSWIMLRNLQTKYGHNGANIEGILREDRGAHGLKINLFSMDQFDDPETIDPRLKEAVRRKRDYERLVKRKLKDIETAAMAGVKRKALKEARGEPLRPNARDKRKAMRIEVIQRAEQDEKQSMAVVNFNKLVRCENDRRPISSVKSMLKLISHEISVGEERVKLSLPFVNLNYRANVRIVDFFPPDLQNFTYAKKAKPPEYEIISDISESDSADSESDDGDSKSNTYKGDNKNKEVAWEWRFFLQLEDATVAEGEKAQKIWVLVDNSAAQNLINLDACELNKNSDTLEALRQRMFLIWGELEERKAKVESTRNTSKKLMPPAHSSGDDEEVTKPKADNVGKSLPFSCCIRQYGVKMIEEDDDKADAGEGRRWVRMYGLFGTMIAFR